MTIKIIDIGGHFALTAASKAAVRLLYYNAIVMI